MPVHIHVAEQSLEVRACERATGRRPIELLLDKRSSRSTGAWCMPRTPRWKNFAGLRRPMPRCAFQSARKPTWRRLLDTARFFESNGRLCIGSDSQSTVNPAEELRWLEYQQRLRKKRRVVLATKSESHVGTRLWRDAALSGAQAIGQPVGTIAVGRRADWLVLEASHPAMAARRPARLWIVCCSRVPISHLRRHGRGRWVVKDRSTAPTISCGKAFPA